MTSKNDITGDSIATKNTNDAYRSGWDLIFGAKQKEVFHLRSHGDVNEEQLLTLSAPANPAAFGDKSEDDSPSELDIDPLTAPSYRLNRSAAGAEPAQWQKHHPVQTGGKWENTNEHDAEDDLTAKEFTKSLLETFDKIAAFLDIDLEAAKTAPGNPSDVYIEAIKNRAMPNAAVEAIKFAIGTTEGIEFLRVWMHGEWDVIRKEWPEAPESVFVK